MLDGVGETDSAIWRRISAHAANRTRTHIEAFCPAPLATEIFAPRVRVTDDAVTTAASARPEDLSDRSARPAA